MRKDMLGLLELRAGTVWLAGSLKVKVPELSPPRGRYVELNYDTGLLTRTLMYSGVLRPAPALSDQGIFTYTLNGSACQPRIVEDRAKRCSNGGRSAGMGQQE